MKCEANSLKLETKFFIVYKEQYYILIIYWF